MLADKEVSATNVASCVDGGASLGAHTAGSSANIYLLLQLSGDFP
jgi:hypothetical protein